MRPPLFERTQAWLMAEPSVHSAVLFGSFARKNAAGVADGYSDIDFHLICSRPGEVDRVDWPSIFSEFDLILVVDRPATGGVRKKTLLFAEGEIDLVIVPASQMRLARWVMRLGLHLRHPTLAQPLNTLSTILKGGYRFLKGARAWGDVYERIARDLPGFRISNAEACRLADACLLDAHWIKRKLARGEFIACQRMLHRFVMETNTVLLHELRLRNGVETYQQSRRVEMLATADELLAVQVDARLSPGPIEAATARCVQGLVFLMKELDPSWRIPPAMIEALGLGVRQR